jgi:glutathione S-transferase
MARNIPGPFTAEHRCLHHPPMSKLLLHQPKGGWGEPSMSPFCMKLECYLRMAEIPFEARPPDMRRAPKGKIPYVDIDGVLTGDSQLIIETLIAKHGDRLDHALSREQRATARLVRRAIEEATYFVGVYTRWSDPKGFSIVKPAFQNILPGPLAMLLPFIRRRVVNSLHAQGVGRHAHDDIQAMGAADWSAISDLLGAAPYFFGERPTSIDAVLYGFVTAVTVFPYDSPLRTHVASLSNLTAHRDRIHARYFDGART